MFGPGGGVFLSSHNKIHDTQPEQKCGTYKISEKTFSVKFAEVTLHEFVNLLESGCKMKRVVPPCFHFTTRFK